VSPSVRPLAFDKPDLRRIRIARHAGSPEARAALERVQAWLELEQRRRAPVAHDGRLATIEEAGGGRSEYVYDQRGDLTRLIEANGQATVYVYDSARRLSEVLHPAGAQTRYAYNDRDLLSCIDADGAITRFEYDAHGRVIALLRGNAGASVYRYDAAGRLVEARTANAAERYEFDSAGRITGVCQTANGVAVTVRVAYNDAGQLTQLSLPGSTLPIDYGWDARGRLQTIMAGSRLLAQFEYDEDSRSTRVRCANGVVESTQADRVDARPVLREVRYREEILLRRDYTYDKDGQLAADGVRNYAYDPLGRLLRAVDTNGTGEWQFTYDAMDNRMLAQGHDGAACFDYEAQNRLVRTTEADGTIHRIHYDRQGRPTSDSSNAGQWTYRYDDAGQLVQALYRGDAVARCEYDYKGRLLLLKTARGVERYVYGPDDQLLAVTDENGLPILLYVRAPSGILAEVHGPLETGAVYFQHYDDRGNCQLITAAAGAVAARFQYAPFGLPSGGEDGFRPVFAGRLWQPDLCMYSFGARWYVPGRARFLTPDPYTGGPDDTRIVNAWVAARRQVYARERLLADWLQQPRLRNRYAFCNNDPVGRYDPNGHWSFGWTLLSVLGAIWTLPNTLFGLLVEITCLVGEVLRWLVAAATLGEVNWEAAGFDAAASSRLDAFALVFTGGWLGSIPGLYGVTFGNVFFVNPAWTSDPHYGGSGVVKPPAYGGVVAITRRASLYEHELRHTKQYGWLGPFYHLGLPLFGVYEWDVILHGYRDAWLERDARRYSESDD
jgi:YD repeat-containing protein